ncbi:TonB-dependent receptor plug domain-containing protein [Pseudaquidulcibacter saccharophilus]|uniref:TonB-dependent receptor plug domain-containing protein n=1 Tax=Pseudaquidulcibacter saccharophilus TaxID=2831900 RepID=UPI001EFF1BFB|nr:TonB-dependent receptor [Pseudaquidulcibacter saccharophilus]
MKYVFATSFLCVFMYANAAFAQEVVPSGATTSNTNEEVVVVTAKRQDAKVKVDRIVYNVKTRPDAISLDASDILKKVPNVFVSATKNVTMNGGAYVSFLVNGHPVKSSIALNIPASQIKQIEVVSNPGAEFASYTQAVINIITIKDFKPGWVGSISAKADTLDGYRLGLDITHGGLKWDFNGSLSFRHSPEDVKTIGVSSFDMPQNDGYILQNSSTNQNAGFDYIRSNAKWLRNYSEDSNLSLELGISKNLFRNKTNQSEQFTGNGINRQETYIMHQRFTDLRHFGTIGYENNKPDDYRLTASLNADISKWRATSNYDGVYARSSRLNTDYWYGDAKTDVEKKLNGDKTLFFGLSDFIISGKDNQSFANYTVIGQTQNYLLDYTDNHFAAYVQIQAKIKSIDIKPGLRYELISRDLKNSFGSISGITDTNLLLPSIHVSKNLNDESKLMASVTLRSDMPDITVLNPAPMYNSLYAVTQGNPNLKTAQKLQSELSYIYDNKAFSINQRIYYRDTKDDINQYTILHANGVYVTSYINAGSSNTYGYSASLKKKFSNKLDASFDFEIFHSEVSAPTTLLDFSILKYESGNSKINVNYNPNKANSFTFMIGYNGKSNGLGMDTSAQLETELEYNHNFARGVSLQINLINFGVSENVTRHIYGEGYNNVQRVKTPSRLLRIGLSKAF